MSDKHNVTNTITTIIFSSLSLVVALGFNELILSIFNSLNWKNTIIFKAIYVIIILILTVILSVILKT